MKHTGTVSKKANEFQNGGVEPHGLTRQKANEFSDLATVSKKANEKPMKSQ
jgi:hypothetical protein